MKVAIIIPRQLEHESIYSMQKTIPLGAAYVGTVLQQQGFDVEILDEFIKKFDPKQVAADAVLISYMTNSANRAYELADYFRSAGKKVILGGPHASLMPKEASAHADHVVIGEGEKVIQDLLTGKIKDKIVSAEKICDLDSLPFPNYDLIRGIGHPPPITMISTSRGCPFDCKFCSVVAIHGRNYRFRSPANVLDEIKMRSPIKTHLFFSDDNFIANKERAKSILRGMIENDTIPKSWGTQVRVEVARDPELLELMSKTNCNLLYIGFESINSETLKEYNKSQNVDDVKNCVKTLKNYGIDVFGMFVVGSDHDTKETVRQTANFALESQMRMSMITPYTPLPGTRLYHEMDAEGRILTKDWKYYDLQHVVHKPKLMTPYELQTELFSAMRTMYSGKKVMNSLLKDPLWSVASAYLAYKTRSWERNKKEYLEFLKQFN